MAVYNYLTSGLGEQLFGNKGSPGDCLVEMFFADVDKETHQALPASFKQVQSKCRCVVATIAFGMGIQIPDVEYILHWGPPNTLMSYWQQVGRGGRDGRPCRPILYCPAFSVNTQHLDEAMVEVIRNAKAACVRSQVLGALRVEGMDADNIDSCGKVTCCSFCASKK